MTHASALACYEVFKLCGYSEQLANLDWTGTAMTKLVQIVPCASLIAGAEQAGVWAGCRAAEERELFEGKVPEQLRHMETFPTKLMAIAAQDDTVDLSRTAGVLQDAFGLPADSISQQDRKEVSYTRPFSKTISS